MERGYISFHGIDSVDYNQLETVRLTLFQPLLKMTDIIMLEFEHFAKSKTAAVNDGGMIKGIQKHITSACTEA